MQGCHTVTEGAPESGGNDGPACRGDQFGRAGKADEGRWAREQERLALDKVATTVLPNLPRCSLCSISSNLDVGFY